MNDILIFGIRNTVGEELISLIKSSNETFRITSYSKSFKKENRIDFLDKNSFKNVRNSENAIWINYGPIWDFSDFLNNIIKFRPELLNGLKAIISCSSTSVLTKKFAINDFDKLLVEKIKNAENLIEKICNNNNIIAQIIRTTLIYGKSKNFNDKNLSKIINFMEKSPILLMPKNSGLRQPIHCSQVAKITTDIVEKIFNSKIKDSNIFEVGGDEEISYYEMINLIKKSLPNNHKGKKCKIIEIPKSLFIFCSLPLIFLSLKNFEAVIRINSDLAGFYPTYKFLKKPPEKFPVAPNI